MTTKRLCDKCGGNMGPPIRSDLLAFQSEGRVVHECVKCGSCRDVCPENAIELLDEVRPAYLLEGAVHRYAMTPRPVELGTAQQMVDTMRLRMQGSDIFER